MATLEDFVDSVHLTDLGMIHYAEHIIPLIQEIIETNP